MSLASPQRVMQTLRQRLVEIRDRALELGAACKEPWVRAVCLRVDDISNRLIGASFQPSGAREPAWMTNVEGMLVMVRAAQTAARELGALIPTGDGDTVTGSGAARRVPELIQDLNAGLGSIERFLRMRFPAVSALA